MSDGLNNETHAAIRKDGREVKPGETIYDFRDELWQFLGITRLPNGASTGRVYVQSYEDAEYRSEVFPSVFDLTILERTEEEVTD